MIFFFHFDVFFIKVLSSFKFWFYFEVYGILKKQNIFPAKALRVVKRLHPLEISIVSYEKRGYYSIVQVLRKYSRGSLPPFDVIKENIIKRYLEEKRKKIG